MDERVTGPLKWFNDAKGCGFMARDGFKSQAECQHGEFKIEQGPKGRAAAEVRKVQAES